MKSITPTSPEVKTGHAPTLPNFGAQTTEQTAGNTLIVTPPLRPLFCPPEDGGSPNSLQEYHNPKRFTASQVLSQVCERGRTKHGDAEYSAKQHLHRLELGERYFSAADIAEARESYAKQSATVDRFAFFEWVWFGTSQADISEHTAVLGEVLGEMNSGADAWRYEGIGADDLLECFERVESEQEGD